jgi:hypothetical protein
MRGFNVSGQELIEEDEASDMRLQPCPKAQAHEKRVAAELNAQYEELREQAQALFAAVKGRRGIRSNADWQAIFKQAKLDQESGRFIIERLGAQRFLEPELMAALTLLRRELLAGLQQASAADRMMADSAVIAYYNMLRMQGWIGSLCLTVERELFGQAPLNEIHGPTVGNQLAEEIARLEDILIPLVDRCHRMMTRSLAALEARRSKPSLSPIVAIAQADQVNVDCGVMNKGG